MPKAVACKCPNCGAAISVQPVNGLMKCDYCQGSIQVNADEEGGVALSVKHINIQGGNVQIADKLTIVQGDTAVTCSFCGRHNLKHQTFRCWRCKVDDLCIEHQSPSGICKWCREEEIAEAKRRHEEAEAEAAKRRAKAAAEANRRQTKTALVVIGSIFGLLIFLCVLVPAFIWLISAMTEISRTAWVILIAVVLAVGVIVSAALIIWHYRNTQRQLEASEDEEDED